MEPNDKITGNCILIVDDDAFDRSLIARNLRSEVPEYELVEVSDSKEAFAVIEDRRPALVLLDVWMPSPDGFKILADIRARADFSGMPVIMLSSSTNPADRSSARSLGADGYEVKPASLSGYGALAKSVSSRLKAG